jgi:hypothetical protein
MTTANEKLAAALKSIAEYIKKKSPETLAEAEHMLNLISVIASETLDEAAPRPEARFA